MYVRPKYARPPSQSGQTAAPAGFGAALRPSRVEMVLLIAATLLALLGNIYQDEFVETTNYLVPALLIIGLSWGCYSLAARNISAIWAPLFWNRVVLVAYFGVGSIVPFFVNSETLTYIQSFYYFFPEDVGKYNLVNCIFMLTYQLCSLFLLNAVEARWRKSRNTLKFEPSSLDIKFIGLALIGVGLIVYYGFILPTTLGLVDATVPLFVAELAKATLVGLFLLTFWALRNKSPLIILVFAIMSLQFAFGLIELNKSEAIFPIIMVTVGFIFDRPTVRRMLIGFAVVLGAYLSIASTVGVARQIVYESVADSRSVAVETRIRALGTAWEVGEDVSLANPIQAGWTRLSYVNAATFAINAYDAGTPGFTFENALVVFIPRILYPDKPSITAGGYQFNIAVQGVDTSQSSPGMPAEGYWNGGWIGVVLMAIFISVVYTSWSIYTLAVLQSGAWHLFFIVLLGMRAGARLDGLFVPDVLGPISYAVIGHIALQFLNRLIAKRGAVLPRFAPG